MSTQSVATSPVTFREPFSGFSHLVGAILAIAGLCILVAQAVLYGDAWHIVSYSVFGACMILMFAASTIYHLIPASDQGVLALKRFDHMAIFAMIAGTYTPICLVALKGGHRLGSVRSCLGNRSGRYCNESALDQCPSLAIDSDLSDDGLGLYIRNIPDPGSNAGSLYGLVSLWWYQLHHRRHHLRH